MGQPERSTLVHVSPPPTTWSYAEQTILRLEHVTLDACRTPGSSEATLLMVGLTLYGLSDAMLVLAGLGLDPWDVLHQGLSRSVGGQVGTWTDIVGVLVLLGWIPLRQRPGVGTVVNVIVIGIVVNICLDLLPSPHGWRGRSRW